MRLSPFASRVFRWLLVPALLAAGLTAVSALEPVLRLRGEAGRQRLVLGRHDAAPPASGEVEGPLFLALPATNWWPGWVPVYGQERDGRFTLRRRPPRGQEHLVQPLFLALPPADEPDAARIAGRWECTALRDGEENFLVWEFAPEGRDLAGRFDEETGHQVAFIRGGTFSRDRIVFTVENNDDFYELTGRLRDGVMTGEWRQKGAKDRGTWRAVRPRWTAPGVDAGAAIPLHEFRRARDDARVYAVDPQPPGRDWERLPRPVCRVWPVRRHPSPRASRRRSRRA
ncbi:MAG: hypothetical protein RJA22_766 [Verrucomicrobiota bacterium]